jgi:hypothetical protein
MSSQNLGTTVRAGPTFQAVLLNAGCSRPVRSAVQAIFPGVHLQVHDIEAITKDRGSLSQAHAVVLGIRNQQGAPATLAIERMREIAPHVGVFVVEECGNIIDPWLRRLALSGADDAFALDRPGDEKILRTVLGNRVALPPPEIELRQLWSVWAECPVRLEAMYCVRNGYRPRHKFGPHEWFGQAERRMRAKFNRAGIPTPLFLTRFGRNLHWTEALWRGKHSRIQLATLLGFESLSQLAIERRRVRRSAARWEMLSPLLAPSRSVQPNTGETNCPQPTGL